MKFFTDKWASGGLSDKEFDEIPRHYRQHLESIAPKLTLAARTLAFGISLHDGLVQKIQKVGRNLEITLIVGDLQSGYHTLKLTYFSGILRSSKAELKALRKKNAVEIIHDEVDLYAKNGFIHRLLTADLRHFEIHFRDLGISMKPRKSGRK